MVPSPESRYSLKFPWNIKDFSSNSVRTPPICKYQKKTKKFAGKIYSNLKIFELIFPNFSIILGKGRINVDYTGVIYWLLVVF